jgi:hypothetical protein
MALLKSVKTNYGIDATYWNIFSINEDFKNKINEIVVVGYISQDARLADSNPVSWQNLQFTNDEYIKDATRALVYVALKTKEFADAQDA